jgi:protein-tyrosine phosphatase
MFNRILVVCVGNICRSPMAEGLLAHHLQVDDMTFSSAGLSALVGQAADSTACTLMQERGIDISAHRARQVTAAMTRDSDLILVMEHAHRQDVAAFDRRARGKTYLIGHWGGDVEVPDPYMGPRAAFEEALDLIQRGTAAWLKKLQVKAS